MKKRRLKPVIRYTLITLLGIIFIYSLSKIIIYYLDLKNTKQYNENLINEVIEVIDKPIDNNTEENKEPEKIFKVNFDKLKSINENTIGWIRYNQDIISQPIVQAKDNSYYLTHTFDKKVNQAGAIFMDYRNLSLDDKNVVIYGHSNNSMFGSLKDIFQKNFFDTEENNYIKIINPNNEVLTYQIFSYYIIEKEEYYITPSFNSNEEFQKFINTISKRSYKKFNVKLSTKDNILTLSTCSGTSGTTKRKVIHAKLISKESNGYFS